MLSFYGQRIRDLRGSTYVHRCDGHALPYQVEHKLFALYQELNQEYGYDTERLDGFFERMFSFTFSYRFCDDCAILIIDENGYHECCYIYSGDGCVCASCREDYYTYLERQDIWVHIDDNSYSHRYLEDILESYNANPLEQIQRANHFARNFRDKTKAIPFYGVELEAELSDNNVGSVAELMEALHTFAIVKSDGSLDNGFEVCTIPATLNYHRSGAFSRSPWKDAFDIMDGHVDSYNTSTCGIHVHVNRESLYPSTTYKMLRVIQQDEVFTKVLANRNSDQWAAFYDYKNAAALAFNPPDEKYLAVRLDKMSTIEFRIFRGNASYFGIISSLEIIDSLRSFALEISMQEATISKYLRWLKENKHLYKYAYTKLQHDTTYPTTFNPPVDMPRANNINPVYV